MGDGKTARSTSGREPAAHAYTVTPPRRAGATCRDKDDVRPTMAMKAPGARASATARPSSHARRDC
jgi:hypothetical protein